MTYSPGCKHELQHLLNRVSRHFLDEYILGQNLADYRLLPGPTDLGLTLPGPSWNRSWTDNSWITKTLLFTVYFLDRQILDRQFLDRHFLDHQNLAVYRLLPRPTDPGPLGFIPSVPGPSVPCSSSTGCTLSISVVQELTVQDLSEVSCSR